MRGWLKMGLWGASLLLASGGPAWARPLCAADQARQIQIGAQRYTVEVAATAQARERGLSLRSHLAAGSGMWFVLPEAGWHGFWMRGMKMPIDLVWVSPERRVLGAATLPICIADPCPISYPPLPAAYVLELGAGGFSGNVGDSVEWACKP